MIKLSFFALLFVTEKKSLILMFLRNEKQNWDTIIFSKTKLSFMTYNLNVFQEDKLLNVVLIFKQNKLPHCFLN